MATISIPGHQAEEDEPEVILRRLASRVGEAQARVAGPLALRGNEALIIEMPDKGRRA